MRSNSFNLPDSHGVYPGEPFGPWDESSQYAPTPGNFGCTPGSPSNPPIDYSASQPTTLQKNKLPLLQFGEWEEGRAYDEDPPTCIHYSIEWKVTLNNRTVAKDTEQDLVLAPKFHWRLFLQPKLSELLCRKYPNKNIESDDTSVTVSVNQHSQRKLIRRFDRTDVDWAPIEKQILDWGDLFLAGKKLRLNISFNYTENSQSSTTTRRTTDKRGSSSATQRMLRDRDLQINEEEDLSGRPSAWKHVYALMRCPGSCELGPHCWQDPYGKKHYKLYRDELLSLVRYVQSGNVLESHEDVPGMIRQQIYKAERRRLEGQKGRSRPSPESSYGPINITNVLPAQTPQQAMSSTSPPSESFLLHPANSPRLDIPGHRDAAVQAYCDWQQSQVANEGWKDEFQKACDVALDDGLDLEQIDELRDPEYFKNRGVKWGIARRFIKDIRYWADNYSCNVGE